MSTDEAEMARYELLGSQRLSRVLASPESAPVLGAAALAGLAGEIVRAIEPLTEASPAAMLGTLLAHFGAMAGRGACIKVGSKPHYPNLFVAVVGQTARDRKGTSAAAVRPVLEAADRGSATFMRDRLVLGVQSGEALIQTAAAFAQTEGPPDQRILVYEEEYSRLLTAAARQNSTLSATLRVAWDGDVLSNRTRQETLTAEHAHVGFVGHITLDELRQKLADVEIANGFANRMLHVAASRTRLHPDPGQLPEAEVERFGARLAEAIAFAQSAGALKRAPCFEQAWDAFYRELESQPSAGRIYDALTARGSAHVLRLSLVYALLDRSPVLLERHLRAAATFWEYCEASVAYIWGAQFGCQDADRLFAAVVEAGLTGLSRTEISALFSNNRSKGELDVLVDQLVRGGVAHVVSRGGAGRPRKVLIATHP